MARPTPCPVPLHMLSLCLACPSGSDISQRTPDLPSRPAAPGGSLRAGSEHRSPGLFSGCLSEKARGVLREGTVSQNPAQYLVTVCGTDECMACPNGMRYQTPPALPLDEVALDTGLWDTLCAGHLALAEATCNPAMGSDYLKNVYVVLIQSRAVVERL